MKKYKKISLLLLLVFFALSRSNAQLQVDTVLLAMQDELDRSMQELQYKDYEQPFFIAYGIDEATTTNITATLGAVVDVSSLPLRTKYVRVMAGDYELNDESLDSDITQSSPGFNSWQVPLGNDYYGIRRSLWISTDQVYKSASRIYAEHQKKIAAEGKPLSEIPHRRFGKVPPVTLISPEQKTNLNKESLLEMAGSLSSIFLNFPDFHNSTVNLLNYHTISYLVNSEGSRVRTYKNMSALQISAAKISPEGVPVFKQLYFLAENPAEWPKREQLEKEILAMAEEMKLMIDAPSFDDSYDGPVLFEGKAVPTVFSNNIVNQFVASDIEPESSGFGVRFNADPFDDKMGKKIGSGSLSISLMPRMKEFEGTKLLGAYEVDNEGVSPAEEINLMKDGVLTNVMTSRTLSKDFHKPTGTGLGPGVVSISVGETSAYPDLKKRLIKMAKEEELEYALIIRDIDPGRAQSCNVYKVSLEDGSEEFFRSARLTDFGIKSLKKIDKATKERVAYNFPDRNAGSAVSYIVPSALLVEDVEIEKSFQRFNVELPLVPSP